jgi:hypothetical protein
MREDACPPAIPGDFHARCSTSLSDRSKSLANQTSVVRDAGFLAMRSMLALIESSKEKNDVHAKHRAWG